MVFVVTGAAGFVGCNLVEAVRGKGHIVYAVVRPGSSHNSRLKGSNQLIKIACDSSDYSRLPELIQRPCDIFYHLAWQGQRDDFNTQRLNIRYSLEAIEAAVRIGCKRFICTGSQAEYGPQTKLITEEMLPCPTNAYGAAKLATCILTRQRAGELGIDWVWGRIFSLYGKYEPPGRMLPDLLQALREGREFKLTAATQNWDYLYSTDGAKALLALGERGRSGEIYNVANGDYRPLREFTEELRKKFMPNGNIVYGEPLNNATSLQVSVDKIQRDTGWKASVGFLEGVRLMIS